MKKKWEKPQIKELEIRTGKITVNVETFTGSSGGASS
jgi:hypothetical protein